MTVNKIAGISQPESPLNNKQVKKTNLETVAKSDNLEISIKAKKLQEALNFVKNVEKLPEVREDIIQKAKEKIDKGMYLNPEIYNKIADNLLKEE